MPEEVVSDCRGECHTHPAFIPRGGHKGQQRVLRTQARIVQFYKPELTGKLLTVLQGSTSYKVQNRMFDRTPNHPWNCLASGRGAQHKRQRGRTWVLGAKGPLLPDLLAKH